MTPLEALWLPILLNIVFFFIASNIIWMVLPIHKKDYQGLGAAEAKISEIIRSMNVAPGQYMFPFCGHGGKDQSAEAKAKMAAGPWGTMIVAPQVWSMGKMLGFWVLNLAIMSVLISYVTSCGVKPGAKWWEIARIASVTGFLAFGGSSLTDSIWKGRPWSQFPGAVFDALIYSTIGAATLVWLWPAK